MSNKYKTYANDKFLGHFPGQDFDKVISKAVNKHKDIFPWLTDSDTVFHLSKSGAKTEEYIVSWSDVPVAKAEFGVS